MSLLNPLRALLRRLGVTSQTLAVHRDFLGNATLGRSDEPDQVYPSPVDGTFVWRGNVYDSSLYTYSFSSGDSPPFTSMGRDYVWVPGGLHVRPRRWNDMELPLPAEPPPTLDTPRGTKFGPFDVPRYRRGERPHTHGPVAPGPLSVVWTERGLVVE